MIFFFLLDVILGHDFYFYNKFGLLLFFVWLFVTFFVLIGHHSLTRIYE